MYFSEVKTSRLVHPERRQQWSGRTLLQRVAPLLIGVLLTSSAIGQATEPSQQVAAPSQQVPEPNQQVVEPNLAVAAPKPHVVTAVIASSNSTSQPSKQYRDAATLLSGQTPGSGLVPALSKSPSWPSFVQAVTTNWNRYVQKIGEPMAQWAQVHMPAAHETVLYPFSGPDFVTVQQLFPATQHYVLMALQNAERPLDLTSLPPDLLEQSLGVLTSAWQHFGVHGFYVTEYLEKYLYSTRANIGASTFLMSFLSLQGFEIDRVVPIQVGIGGVIEEQSLNLERWKSVRIQASKEGKQITVDYFKIDLSNAGLQAAPDNLELLRKLAVNPVLFKAASHLPQNADFNIVAKQVLERAPLIVQDETGLKYSTLTTTHQVALFGKFVIPHHAFQNYQGDLAQAFSKREDIKPLNFRFGYFKDGNYALMVATRK